MTPQPVDLTMITDDLLRIAWSDGMVRMYSVNQLRAACPCATCREKRLAPPPPPTELTVLSPAEAAPLRLAGMKPVGRYAYAIAFSDGHDTGIYALDLLRDLGREVEAESGP